MPDYIFTEASDSLDGRMAALRGAKGGSKDGGARRRIGGGRIETDYGTIR